MNILASKEKSDSALLDDCLALYRSQINSKTEQAATASKLMELVYPYLLESARYQMQSGKRGRDFSKPEDLTNAVVVKIFYGKDKDEILPNYQIGGGFISYIRRIVENELNNDIRRELGRGTDDNNEYMPRVYLYDPELMEGRKSKKRTQSAYIQLKQVKDLLHIYLQNLPGKIAIIPTNVRNESPSMKRVTLTNHHVALLKVWMDPSNEDVTWKEVSELIGKPVGTIKRWFLEVCEHLKNDPDNAAQRLRDAYRVGRETAFLSPDTDYAD